jgi:hypothetical protein
MPDISSQEKEILKTAFFDGRVRVNNGAIIAIRTNVALSGLDYVKAFRSLRAQAWFNWAGHSPEGGELYDLSDSGRQEAEKYARPAKPSTAARPGPAKPTT